MATIRLVPSTIAVSNTQYVTLSDETNMKTNTDSTSSGTITHNRASTNNTYYAYIKGFNVTDVPSDATDISWTVKIKAKATGHTTSTSTSYQMTLLNNTSSIGSTYASGRLSTTTTTFTFSQGSVTWNQIRNTYGSNFGIRIPLRRASSNTADVVTIYGAEIEVTYTPATPPRTITSTLTGNGTIDPEGAVTLNDGDNYTLIIQRTNSSDTVSATKNGSSITLTHHDAGTITKTATAESLTTGFSGGTSMAFYTSSSSTGHNFDYAIGHTAESPGATSSGSGSWTYVKDNGSSTNYTGYVDFLFDFSEIPSNATINSVQVKCYGATESTSESTAHSEITLYSGTTQKSTSQKFTSTSNSIITISSPGTWTAAELHEAKLRFVVGYYGGHIFGITWTVNYTSPEYYSYEYEVDGDATIAVTIGSGGGSQPKIYIKKNGTWTQYSKIYKKVNGSWVEQSNSTWSTLFNTSTNYRLIET